MSDQSYDPRIDDFLARCPAWQKEIFVRARRLIHEAEPEIKETVKRTDWPFFVLQGNVCAFQSTKDHANLYIYDPLVPDPDHIVTQGESNQTGRLVQIYENQSLPEAAFKNMIKAVADHNRAGGWRKISKA